MFLCWFIATWSIWTSRCAGSLPVKNFSVPPFLADFVVSTGFRSDEVAVNHVLVLVHRYLVHLDVQVRWLATGEELQRAALPGGLCRVNRLPIGRSGRKPCSCAGSSLPGPSGRPGALARYR